MPPKRHSDSKDIGTTKKPCQSYKESYKDVWRCLGPSKKGETYVHCIVCDIEFSCSHSGKSDCRRHVKSKSHIEMDLVKKQSKPLEEVLDNDIDSVCLVHLCWRTYMQQRDFCLPCFHWYNKLSWYSI